MKRTPLLFAVCPLALAVSPLFAQQDAPGAPDPAPAAVDEPVVEVPADEAAVEEVQTIEERLIELLTQELAPQAQGEAQGDEVQEAEATEDDAPEGELDDDMLDNNNGPIAPAQLQPAQGQFQQLVVRGNVQFQVGGRGGLGNRVRVFNDEIASLPELECNAVTEGVTREGNPGAYRFEAEGPGLLTVAVRAKNRDDLTLEVYDMEGRQIARCDIDFNGNNGAEHLAVPLPEAGSYRVVVEPFSGGGAFWIGSSYLRFDGLEALAPYTPDDATQITPGQAQDAAVGGGGPNEQWFVFTAPSEGMLVFRTTTDNGDLVMEAYNDGDYENNFQYSDQDRNGSVGNERIIIDMAEGQVVYFKVRPLSAGNDIEFSTRAQFMDTSE